MWDYVNHRPAIGPDEDCDDCGRCRRCVDLTDARRAHRAELAELVDQAEADRDDAMNLLADYYEVRDLVLSVLDGKASHDDVTKLRALIVAHN